jgi:hypothetical protein
MSEIKLQAKIFQHFYNNHPETRGLIFHVPNGGNRSEFEGSQLKASGVVAGIPDLIILNNGKAYGLELKTEIGAIRDVQIKIHSIWASNGIEVLISRDFESSVNYINEIFGFI